MRSHRITGGGRVQLHVVESGNPRGRPILFLHGTSQCWLQWSRQLSSSLAESHRLVALDLRGHGLSDKPRDAYGDSRLWADDVHSVIQALELDHPVLSGWSYGPLVALDYVRHHGEERLAGLHLVGAISKLGSDAAMSVLSAEFLELVPQFLSADSENCVRGLDGLLRLCFATAPSLEERYQMLGYNVAVPSYVRQGLFARAFDNDDLLPRLKKPVLLTHGAQDAIVKPMATEQHQAAIPHAQVQWVQGAGHAAFWDDPAAFNDRLHAFCETL
jgi:non-heme chloroperoxidase